MNKVIIINLGGRSYSVEEPGYVLLKEYLDSAAKKLEDNPDKDEVIKDFNLAIAEKCDLYLSASKNVILAGEIEKIIADMGPVEPMEGVTGDHSGKQSPGQDEKSPKHKKFYLLPEAGMIFGVCSGLAAYFDVDPTIVRVIFVILAIITHGAALLAYLIMALVVPRANTPEEKAEAWGSMRMTANDLMQRAQAGYQNFKNKEEWKKWKRQIKEEKRRWEQRERWYAQRRPSASYEFIHSVLGMLWLAFFIYIAWYGYGHIPVVHNFFNALGEILGAFLGRATGWLKSHTG